MLAVKKGAPIIAAAASRHPTMPLRKWFSAQAAPTQSPPQSPAHLSPQSQSYSAPTPRPASYHDGSLGGGNRSSVNLTRGSSPPPVFPVPQLYRASSHQDIGGQQYYDRSSGGGGGGGFSHATSYSADYMYRGGLNRNESVFSFDTEYSNDIDAEFEVRIWYLKLLKLLIIVRSNRRECSKPRSLLKSAAAQSVWSVPATDLQLHRLQEDGVRLFQEGRLPPDQEQWHKLIPPEAVEVLGKKVVQRQSICLCSHRPAETTTAHSKYLFARSVRDNSERTGLCAGSCAGPGGTSVVARHWPVTRLCSACIQIFIDPLLNFQPPIISANRLNDFVSHVFNNMNEIRMYHEPSLSSATNCGGTSS